MPTLVKEHTYCTSLTWPSLLEGSGSQSWKREKNLWAKISYHWLLLPSLPFSPLPSYKTWAALGSLSHPTTGLHCDTAVLLRRPWKQAWLFHLQPISGTAFWSRCILGRTLHGINYSVEGFNHLTPKYLALEQDWNYETQLSLTTMTWLCTN